VGFATISLLEGAGCMVTVPETQTCCGQPAYNSGDNASSITIAKQTIAAFESFDYVVAPSGSCAAMIKVHYAELLESEPTWAARARELSAKTYELTQFLTDVLEHTPEPERFNATVTYHDSCSGLRELGIKQQPRKLLENVAQLNISEMEDTDICCGFGGTFCVKYPDISTRMVSDKIALAIQTRADVLLGGDLGCLLNIAGRASRVDQPMRVYHVAEVLAGMTDVPAIGEQDTDPTRSNDRTQREQRHVNTPSDSSVSSSN
jgi:L-lactate dehydrogenase complex protein LldE